VGHHGAVARFQSAWCVRAGIVTAYLLWFVVLTNGAWFLATSIPDDLFGIIVGATWAGLMCCGSPAFLHRMRRLRAEVEPATR